ncbi:MAG TPA: L,D-transpeptidase family protein [Jatrophihabitans sp.]|jgi:L,D-peptidoglycan transpeptidase YkuD (ErfK/YbiS/YcfS/YnhG family)
MRRVLILVLTVTAALLPAVVLAPAPADAAATVTVPTVVRKYGAADAKQIITVTANRSNSTVATLSAWTKSGKVWKRAFGPITAHLGSAGVGKTHEGASRTPAGSFTLTRAFGAKANPGLHLPYHHTTPADFWVEQVGNKYYNQLRTCPSLSSSRCGFSFGAPTEHLYYETPYYNYAVVIDYNTTNATGGVKQGAGSAFFLHVTDGAPTAGCVAIDQAKLLKIMKWLKPSAHPRIIIGTRS